LRALRHLPVVGTLAVIDPKRVGLGNPNRCLYFTADDEGAQKALLLAERAQADFPSLQLQPQVRTFAEFVRDRGRVQRAIVATDSRRVRRSIQGDLPLEIIDASTTDIREIIVHSHRQPTDDACLACIYRHIPEEQLREREIARGLGIALEDVSAGFITQAIAAKIVRSHPDLLAADIEGMAFDSLFKQRCAEQRLPNAAGMQVLAPFAFVSNLAGALLALEVARIDHDGDDLFRTNYFFLSPWSPPNLRARSTRPRDQGCEFCSRPQGPAALTSLWTDKIGKRYLEVV
jgi:molybdopterin/thiamine biosynthesis adenylyltransferase